MKLVLEVFLDFEWLDYTEESTREFKKTIDDISFFKATDYYDAYNKTNKILV